jgi:hypothetical protein
MKFAKNPIPHGGSAERGNCWCPLESDCGLECQAALEFGEGVKEDCGDGGTVGQGEQVTLTFWSTDTSSFGIVWLQTARAAEAGLHTQRPLHLHHHLARKSVHSS